MLGTVFGFIASDVKQKLEILETYRSGPNGDSYANVESMLTYEKESGHLKTNKNGNASRTFLRLHRALLFVSEFLGKTLRLGDNEGTAGIAREAYSTTLSKYHPWLIQKGAMMAMYTLPSKKQLFKQLKGDVELSENEVDRMLREAIDTTRTIYDETEKLLIDHDMLNLP